MRCREFRDLLPDLQAVTLPPEALKHTHACQSCAALQQQYQLLRGGLRQLAAESGAAAAPPRVQAALLEQFRAQRELPRRPMVMAPRRPAPVFAPLPAGILSVGALAAALAAFVLWSHPPGPRAVPGPAVSVSAAVTGADDIADPDNGFIPLPYFSNSGLVSEAEADADVVRVEMPRSALVALGVPVAEENASGPVEAELLLGAGGMPQAVRILE
jgi:hypothetical protein